MQRSYGVRMPTAAYARISSRLLPHERTACGPGMRVVWTDDRNSAEDCIVLAKAATSQPSDVYFVKRP
jgi:hypothetical protein